MICDESEASVVILGALSVDLTEFDISGWTRDGIVADGPEGNCAIGHRLSLDFKSNSVTVTDYPKRGWAATVSLFKTQAPMLYMAGI